VDERLSRAHDAIATEDVDRALPELSEEDADTLLELAHIAAHVSGERTNAPLFCYLIGRAQGGRPLDELAEAVRRSTS
jgi:hypothetical protein